MKITIITVCLNAEYQIQKTIESVLNQTYRNTEYIIIDGKSTDKTIEIINRYKKKIDVFISENDSGIYNAMNKAIRLSTGEIIIFMNAGDEFYNNYVLAKIHAAFKKNNVDLVFGNTITVNPDTHIKKLIKYPQISKWFFLFNTICHQSIAVKRKIFIQHGLFNEKYKILADYDWILRVIYKKRISILYLNSVLSFYSLGGVSAGNQSAIRKEKEEILLQYYNIFERLFNNQLGAIFLLKFKNVVRELKNYVT